MFELIITLSTNLFRTYLIRKFMTIFFETDVEDKRKEKVIYFLFFLFTSVVYLQFHFPPANIFINILMIYLITLQYVGEQKKKILITLLIYGINMICDVLSMYSCNNYIVGREYNEMAAYITVFLISICEFIIERFLVKKREISFVPPYWNILLTIPVISIGILLVLIMNNLNNRRILIIVSAGILLINLLIFYLYDALVLAYLKLEENTLFERQIASFSNQLNVLTQSEEKVRALRHDMKHHLNELLAMANKCGEKEICDYIHNMHMYMENPHEYVSSGNKEIDSLLNYMLNKAENILTKVDYKINVPKELSISSFDLNVIIGNLMDNAILASSHSKKKWLSVSLSYEKGMLFINVRNSYDDFVEKSGNDYLSTKKEARGHGIGLQNVKKVVNSYRGTMQITDTHQIFDVKIMLYTLLMK